MYEILSPQNKYYKTVKSLLNKKYRMKLRQFIIEGERFIEYAIENKFALESILISESYKKEKLTDEKVAGYGKEASIYCVEDNIFEDLIDTEQSQGIIAVLNMPKQLFLEDLLSEASLPQIVFLDRLQDPGNVGTIIRTADACGIKYVLVAKGTVDVYNSKVIRSTAGSILNVNIIEVECSLLELSRLKDMGYRLLVTSLDANYMYDNKMAYGRANCLVVGNEANGVSADIQKLTEYTVKIPIYGRAESLNVSVATGIMLYKIVEYCIQP